MRSESTLRHDPKTFFLDRCFGGYDLAELLRANGLTIEVHKDHFNSDAEDTLWIPEVGKRGWAIITKDKRVRSRQIEIVALLQSGQPTFVLTSGAMSASDNAKSIMAAMPQMIACINKYPPPFVAQITAAGALSMLATHSDLIKKLDPP